MKLTEVRVPAREERPAPVTILDGTGRVIRVVPADEFRRTHGPIERPALDSRRRRGARVRPGEVEASGVEPAVVER